MWWHNLFSKLVRRIKGEKFELDNRIPLWYLFALFVGKVLAYLRGLFAFRRFGLTAFIGPKAVVRCKSKISFGQGFSLGRSAYLDALSSNGVFVGRNFSLGRGASIECSGTLKDVGEGFKAGDNVGIGSFSYLGCAGGVEIGSDTILGNFVSCHSENHVFDRLDMPIRAQGTTRSGINIGRNCWIGAKVTILDGAIIGDNTVIAAGAVVLGGKYPPNVLMGGVPARILKVLS